MGRSGERGLLGVALASRYWSAADAEVVLRAQQASGLSEVEFSRRHGLRGRRLERWRRRLGDGAQTTAWTTPATLDFLPVRALASPPMADGAEERHGRGVMEVILRGGRRVLVGAEVDPAAVARLAAALEGQSC